MVENPTLGEDLGINELKVTSGQLGGFCTAPGVFSSNLTQTDLCKGLSGETLLARDYQVKHLAGCLLGWNYWFCKTKYIPSLILSLPPLSSSGTFQPSYLSTFLLHPS